MKKLLLSIAIISLTFLIFLFSSLNVNATSSEETTLADENIDCSEDESEENSVRSIPGGEEPDNEQWYGVELNNGVLILKDDKYYNIDYSAMPKLITHLKPGDIIYEPNGAVIGDLVGHIAMVYDIVYDEIHNKHYVITIESFTGGVQYGMMTPTRFDSKNVEIYRLIDASEAQIQGAIAWADAQYGAAWFFKAWKKTEPGLIPVWYCAELIWAAYYHQGIYLDQDDNNNYGSIVYPYEIAAYQNAIPILHDSGEDYQAEVTSIGTVYHKYSFNGKTYTEEHDYEEYQHKYRKCRICEYVDYSVDNLEYQEISDDLHSCECSICGYVFYDEHTIEYDGISDENHSVSCMYCDYTYIEEHTYEPYNSCYEKCTTCGYKHQIAEHDYTDHYVANVDNTEKHYSYCECGAMIEENHTTQIVVGEQITLDVCVLCGYNQSHEHYYTYTSNKDGETHMARCACGSSKTEQCFGPVQSGTLSRCVKCKQVLKIGIAPFSSEEVSLPLNKEDDVEETTE